MADWMEQQISDADDGDDNTVEAKGNEEFASQIRTMVATGSVEKLSVSLLRDRLGEVDDVEALESGLDNDTREDAQEEYRARLNELGALTDEGEADTEDGDTEEEEAEGDTESAFPGSDDSEEEEDESTPGVDECVHCGAEIDEGWCPECDGDEDSDESADTSTDEGESEAETPETTKTPDPEPDTGDAVGDGGSSAVEVDVKSIAPDVITADDAAERDPRYTMLVWADPGQGKTHFACTSPEPVVIIDTEGKADQVARKFKGEGEVPQSPFIFQPTDYDEAVDALDSALDILDEYRTKAGLTGTLVVDSMSVMWGWSQQKYVEKFYPGKDASEVEFSSAFGGGQSDWKQIKRYHNVKFRQVMLDSPYHLVWTAMREDDYEEAMKGNQDADKPAGEKENAYKVDEVLRIEEGEDGAPVGVLNKSGKVKHRYSGLRYPTFDKHQDLVNGILDAENGSRSMSALAGAKGVQIHEGNPKFQKDDE